MKEEVAAPHSGQFWAVPPINAAVKALSGCLGETAVIFATCNGLPKDTLPLLAEVLAAKGVQTAGESVLDKDGLQDKDKTDAQITAVKSTDGGA